MERLHKVSTMTNQKLSQQWSLKADHHGDTKEKKNQNLHFYLFLLKMLGGKKMKSPMSNKWIDSGKLTLTMGHKVTCSARYLEFPEGSEGGIHTQWGPHSLDCFQCMSIHDFCVWLTTCIYGLHHFTLMKSTLTKLTNILKKRKARKSWTGDGIDNASISERKGNRIADNPSVRRTPAAAE